MSLLGATPLPDETTRGLESYRRAVREALPDTVLAVYLHGSIALGDFQDRSSDIDFVTVLNRQLSNTDLERLGSLHCAIHETYPNCRFSGNYLKLDDLGRPAEQIVPAPFYHDGVFRPEGRHDLNDVTWWILKFRRVVLFEESPLDFEFIPDWDILSRDLRQNLATYWARFRWDPRRLPWLFTEYGVEWIVLGPLRLYFSLREHSIASKTEAGHYALDNLPRDFHPIIEEALRLRHGRPKPHYRLRTTRAIAAFRLLGNVLRISR